MSERAPYSRIYWSVLDDPKFVGIIDDDAAFALWVRLLMTADALWPAPAPLPRSARTKPLSRLVDAGLIDLLSGDRYRVHGLNREREQRQSSASASARARWERTQSERDANASDTHTERNASQAKPSLAEPSRAETPREDDPAETYWSLTGRFPTEKPLAWIDDLTGRFGAAAVNRAIALAFVEDKSPVTLLGRVQDRLRAEARQLDRSEREAETQRLAEKRAAPRVEEPWKAEYREAIRRQYAELDGAA